MNRRMLVAGLLLGAVALAFAGRPGLEAKQARPVVKVGIYDSRVVALAYHRSTEQEQAHLLLREEYNKAKAAKDEKRVKEFEQEGPWTQVRMHQQVFSTAGLRPLPAFPRMGWLPQGGPDHADHVPSRNPVRGLRVRVPDPLPRPEAPLPRQERQAGLLQFDDRAHLLRKRQRVPLVT